MSRRAEIESAIDRNRRWAGFSKSDIWSELKARIEKEIIAPAETAFHSTAIDGKSDSELVRNMMSQRANVLTGKKIISFVESSMSVIESLEKELENIKKAEKQNK